MNPQKAERNLTSCPTYQKHRLSGNASKRRSPWQWTDCTHQFNSQKHRPSHYPSTAFSKGVPWNY